MCVLLLLTQICQGQQGYFYQYSTRSGLPSNQVHAISADKQGYIWIPSDKGITKFNGKTFKTFSQKDGLLNNDIFFSENIDSSNRLWLYDYEYAFTYIDRDTVHVSQYPNGNLWVTFMHKLPYTAMGNLVVASGRQNVLMAVYKNGHSFSMHAIDFLRENVPFLYGKMPLYLRDTVQAYENFKDYCKLGVYDNKVALVYDSTIILYDTRTGEYDSVGTGEMIYSDFKIYRDIDPRFFSKYFLYPTKSGNLLNGVNLKTREKKTIDLGKYAPGFSAIITNIIINDSLYNLTTDNRYMIRINDDMKVVDTFRWNGKNSISNLTKDPEGNLWASTYNDGLYVLSKHLAQFKPIETEAIKSRIVNVYRQDESYYIFDDESNLFITDNEFKIKTKKQLPRIHQSYPEISRGWFLPVNDNGYFIATAYGAYYMTEDLRLTNYKYSITNTSFKNYVYDSSAGKVAAGHSFGVGYFNTTDEYISDLLFTKGQQRVLHISKGVNNMYYGSGDHNSIYRYDSMLKFIDSVKIKTRVPYSGMFGEHYIFSVEDYGIYDYNIATGSVKAVHKDDNFRFYKIGANGLWVANEHYIMHINFQKSAYRIDKKYLNLKGLLYKEVYDVTERDSFNILACDMGLVKLPQYYSYYDTNFTKSAYLCGIEISPGQKFSFYKEDSVIKYDYTPENLRLFFTSSSISFLGDVQYKYFIDGETTSWLTTDNESVNYAPLSPGEYKVRVKAQVNHIGLETEEAVFTIIVRPLWWQSVLFKISVVLILAGFISYLVYLRIRTIKIREQRASELNQKMAEYELSALQSQMNPHFIFNSLTSIQSFINTNRGADADMLLRKFSLLVRLYLEFSRKKLITIEQEIKALQLYTEIERSRFNEKFDVVMRVRNSTDKTLNKVFIPPMLVQPLVENAINHGLYHMHNNEGVLKLYVLITEGKTVIVTDDNGIGRKAAKNLRDKIFPSVGNRIISDRIAILNESGRAKAELKIVDKYNKDGSAAGTRVILTIINTNYDTSISGGR